MTTTMRSQEKPSSTNLLWVSMLTGRVEIPTFAGLKTTTCGLCASISHTAKILFFVNFQPSLSVSNRQSSPYSFASNSRTDRYGRYSQFHNGKEICNDFNSLNGCNATHKNFSRISHICRVCKASTHAAFNVQRADYQGQTTTSD